MAGAGLMALSPASLRLAMAAESASPVRIANTTGAINLVMGQLMAQEKFLESFDLAPTILQVADGSKVLSGVVAGSLDLTACSGFGQIFPAVERGATLKVLAGALLPPTLVMFSSKPYVKTLKDLEGKTIGTGSIGALVYQLTATLLRKYNVDISKIQFVNVGSSSDIFRAVSAGTVDAGAGEAAKADDPGQFGVHTIEHGNMLTELSDYTYQGAWTSDRVIGEHRDVLVRTLAAYAKLYRFAQDPNNKDAFLKAQLAYFKTGPDSTGDLMWNFIQKYKPYTETLVLSHKRIAYMQNLNIGFKVHKKMLPFDKVADMSLAEDAIKLLNKS